MKSVSSSGNTYVVDTEMVPITEVIKNGTFSFDVEPEWSSASSMRLNGQEILGKGERIGLEPITKELNHGNITHQIKITPKMVNGKINSCDVELLMFSLSGSTSWKVTGSVKLPRQRTNIVIKDGKLKDFSVDNDDFSAELELSMANAGDNNNETSIVLPELAIKFPVRFIPTPSGPVPNPIPTEINIGMQLVTRITSPDPVGSATAKTGIKYNAQGGFKLTGSGIDADGDFSGGDITGGTFDSGANIGMPVDLQFGIAFPRIGLKLAGQEVAYMHLGLTTGSKLNWNGFDVCKSGYSKVVLEGGYSLKVLGQTLLSGKKEFAKAEKKAGKEC